MKNNGATRKSPEMDKRGGRTSRYTLSRKHQSIYLNYRETKLDLFPHLRYQYYYHFQNHCRLYHSLVTCTNRQNVGDLKWVYVCETGVVFINGTVRMRVVTLPLRPHTIDANSWRAHSTSIAVKQTTDKTVGSPCSLYV
jgi:hypothetical protein